MPGIFGAKFKYTGKSYDPLSLVENMAESLRHNTSYKYRLESIKNGAIGIIDIKALEQDQFIYDSEGKVTIAIYGNLFDIIDPPDNSGYLLQGKLNAKTVNRLYQRCGASAIHKLNGDFNLCIHDEQKNLLTIGNDRFGFRHLYIYEDEKIIMFSPEIKAFLKYKGFDKSIDEQGLADYFNFSYQLGNRTFFRHVKLLPPATILNIAEGVTRKYTYWSAKYEPSLNHEHLNDAVDEGYRLFVQSMERRTKGKRRLIVPLSGGLDSRLIISTAAKLGCEVVPVSFGFRKSADVQIAKKVCKTLGLPLPVLVQVKPDFISKYGPEVCELGECGYGSLGMSTIHAFFETLGSNFDGLLNGIFGGHLSFGSPYFNRTMLSEKMGDELSLERIARGLQGHRFKKFLGGSATPYLTELTNTYYKKSIEREWQRTLNIGPHDLFRQDQLFINNRIRRCMNAIDHNRFFFIDELPFASYELFDFYHKLDFDLLLEHFLYKEIYKKKLPELAAIPWQSTGVDLYSKNSMFSTQLKRMEMKINWYIKRASRGKINPVSRDRYEDLDGAYRKDASVSNWINDIILSNRHLSRGYFTRDGLMQLIKWEEKGGSAFFEMSKVAMFELFSRKYLDD